MTDMSLRPLPGLSSRIRPGDAPLPAPAREDRRARILGATAALIAEQGYHATTLEQIVRRARVGWPVFYKRFADKEAAFLALLDETLAAATTLLETAAARVGDPWPARVTAGLGAIFEAIAAHPNHARACLVEALAAGPTAVARYERALQSARPLLLAGRAFNPRAAELSDTLEDTLAGAVAWIAYQRLVENKADQVPTLLPETLEFVLLPYLGEKDTSRAVARYAVSGNALT